MVELRTERCVKCTVCLSVLHYITLCCCTLCALVFLSRPCLQPSKLSNTRPARTQDAHVRGDTSPPSNCPFCHFDDTSWLISPMLDLNPRCVCLCSSEHWAQAAEGRPHGHTPPPAGHEDRPGSSSAGLLPQAAGRRARTGTKHQQVSLCLLLLLSENTLKQWDTTNKHFCSCPGGQRQRKYSIH